AGFERENDLMSQFGKAWAALVLAGALLPGAGAAQGDPWAGPVRGSWVRTGTAAAGDVVLASGGSGAESVVGTAENLNVRQAVTRSSSRPPALCRDRRPSGIVGSFTMTKTSSRGHSTRAAIHSRQGTCRWRGTGASSRPPSGCV